MRDFSRVTNFSGVWERSTQTFHDNRGYFLETYRENLMPKDTPGMIQDNFSESKQFVLRGIHFQVGQSQLVTVLKGAVIDLSIDLRPNSPSFLKVYKTELNQEKNNQLLLPAGFGHGYLVLSPEAILNYKSSKYYGESEQFTINILESPFISLLPKVVYEISERDSTAPNLSGLLEDTNFVDSLSHD
ncbi:RfbC dTDP-4-dehydrorhamnose 3,5-epimerase and related enzymes [actinobacterium SCGC AAA044-D11]